MSDYNLDNLNILVVDDNRHMHAILRAILNAMRIKHIRYCDDPADAFSEMRDAAPDLIITDWKMEPLDGLDFVRLVRTAQDRFQPGPPPKNSRVIMRLSSPAPNRLPAANA